MIEEIAKHIYRICENCNQEYPLPFKWTGNAHAGLIVNAVTCPHCGEGDHPWILIKVNEIAEEGLLG